MRNILTDSEILAASRLDDAAIAKAKLLGESIQEGSDSVTDVLRVVVCELAFRQYVPFALKFQAGNPQVLRQLLDGFWLAIESKMPFPSPDACQEQLGIAAIDLESWSNSSATDAAMALCVFDITVGQASSATGRGTTLVAGLESLFGFGVKKMIDDCLLSGGDLVSLAESVESCATPVLFENDFRKVLEVVDLDGDASELISLVRAQVR